MGGNRWIPVCRVGSESSERTHRVDNDGCNATRPRSCFREDAHSVGLPSAALADDQGRMRAVRVDTYGCPSTPIAGEVLSKMARRCRELISGRFSARADGRTASDDVHGGDGPGFRFEPSPRR